MANAPVTTLSVITTNPIMVAVCRHSASCFRVRCFHSHQPHTQLNGGIPKNAMFTAQAVQFIVLESNYYTPFTNGKVYSATAWACIGRKNGIAPCTSFVLERAVAARLWHRHANRALTTSYTIR